MSTFLFQGDSITDAGRTQQNWENLGMGYPLMFSADMLHKFPENQFRFINRGISGNRIVDLYARIKADFINIEPDYISILIGVNDVWHEISHQNGVHDEKFEMVYSMLIEELLSHLPSTTIFILEPFVLKGPATEAEWDTFNIEVRKRAASARRVAEKYELIFVPLQDKFDELCKKAPATYWLGDGVHPTSAGHHFIKEELKRAFVDAPKKNETVHSGF